MADSAEFFRNPIPDTSRDRDGSDTSGGKNNCYQMVPVGGSREFGLRVTGKVQVAVARSGPITISAAGGPAGARLGIDGGQGKDFTIRISSVGGEGRTQIVAATLDGKPLDRLVVSIKAERPLRYNLHRLQDIVRVSSRSFADLQTMMISVEKYFLSQANIRLSRHRTQTLFIKKDLGDPFDDTPTLAELIDRELQSNGFHREHLNLISTWNLGDNVMGGGPVQGSTPFTLQTFRRQMCFAKAQEINEEINTYVHEIGHALGLLHDGQPDNFLMNDKGFSGYAMKAADIDHINPSGSKATP